MSSEEENLSELPLYGDILQHILGRLPLIHLLPALHVSRSWSHAVRSSLLHLNPSKPWLLLHHSHSHSPLPRPATAYDPSSLHWLRLQRPACPATGTLRSSGNMLYAISPSKISFSVDPLHLTWHHLDGPLVWRADPIVALVGRSVVVAGGACDFEDDPMAVETYDLDAGTWSSCDSMPSVLRDCPASTCLSVASVGDNMYVMEKATGALHVYDALKMTWEGPVDLGIAGEGRWWAIGGMRGGLVVAAGGLVSGKGVRVWEVEVGTWRVGEMGEIPGEMAGKFGEGGRSMGVCCSDRGWAYVYGGGEGGEVAWCELGGKGKEGGWKWGWVEEGDDEVRTEAVLTCGDVGLEELDLAMMMPGVEVHLL
ncbi:hypothetical protein MLD38_011908 [Melastoma candidum]|uniref:Uncharacterized protein n=1 Tax=Melastoma candidum TaxID=119954 RepID=A0ACB9R7K7_9MYRT|nr:hypothetical protein MLD38_011908 [Melastoma candidum]